MTTSDGLREQARAVVPSEVWAFIETGAGNEISLREAEQAWQSYRFRPRVLRDVSSISTSTTLLGHELRTPVLAAPTACHRVLHPEGELAFVAGTHAAGSLPCVSMRSTTTIEDVGAAAAGPWWQQVYVMAERDITASLVERAVAAGASALVLTGDTPYVSRRARSPRAIPNTEAEELVNVLPHLNGRPRSALEQNPAITLNTIDWLTDLSGLPVLVKGVLRADDALDCLDAGAAGLVVSNHGARQLDRAIPTAHALPEVVEAVAGRAPVLVDGGIRCGFDVLAALALGADAVMIGRPTMYGLAAGGADGVRDLLDTITDELAHVMGLAGASSLSELDRSLVSPKA